MNKLKLIYLSIYLLFLYIEFILKKIKISYASLKQLSLYIFAYGKFLLSSKFFSRKLYSSSYAPTEQTSDN